MSLVMAALDASGSHIYDECCGCKTADTRSPGSNMAVLQDETKKIRSFSNSAQRSFLLESKMSLPRWPRIASE